MNTNSPSHYLLKPTRPAEHRYAYVGVPHDAATSLGNPGGRLGPQALREALRGVFEWRLQNGQLADVDRGIVDLSAVEVADFGDLALSYLNVLLAGRSSDLILGSPIDFEWGVERYAILLPKSLVPVS